MKAVLFEAFVFNDFIMPEKPDALCPGQAHVVCTICDNKYDNSTNPRNWVPPNLPKHHEYWYVWMLDHTALELIVWMKDHLERWHPER